jgi:hypothetical protein
LANSDPSSPGSRPRPSQAMAWAGGDVLPCEDVAHLVASSAN